MIQGKLQRSSSRLIWRHPGSYSTNFLTSIDSKFPKIVKSSASTENPKLEYPTVLIIVGLSHVMNIVRTKSTSKTSF
jgi:hypothetical protein